MKKQARKLRILIIDDNPKVIEGWPSLHFIEVGSFEKFSRELRADRDSQGADIFLVDLNMEEFKPIPAALKWGPGNLPSFGVILALPFLRPDRPIVFKPYSSSWGSGVADNGHVIVATSLLLSTANASLETLERTADWIRNGKPVGTRLEALGKALPEYRERLKQRPKRSLVDVARVVSHLEYLEQSGITPTELSDHDGPLSIGLLRPDGRTDWIEVASIFADVVNSSAGTTLSLEVIRNILAHLSDMAEKSVPYEPHLFHAARDLLGLLNPVDRNKEEQTDQDLVEVMEKNTELWKNLDRYQVIRLCMLFAWVIAAYAEKSDDSDSHAYKPTSRYVEAHVRDLLGIYGKSPTIDYRRLLARSTAKADFVSEEEFRTAFKKAGCWTGTTDAYQLGETHKKTIRWATKDQASLTGMELYYCRLYAEDVLGWKDHHTRPYPDWLRA